jgi:serine/threonine protein kinase
MTMDDEERLADLLLAWEAAVERGENLSVEHLCRDCPHLASVLAQQIADLKKVAWLKSQPQQVPEAPPRQASGVVAPPRPLRRGSEVIPGYRLGRHLGRGGFGHVRVVDCPDGLQRAAKVMHNPLRAQMELAGLERIQGIDHPMILSLHRIEATEHSLVVISELAYGSLDELFAILRRIESPTQVIATCLPMLLCVAEALDCLQQQYELLHLDIKPANILHCGRAWCKVGDLGTLVSLRNAGPAEMAMTLGLPDDHRRDEVATVNYRSPQAVPWGRAMQRGATLLTGAGAFTPYYAPPEAFRGKISNSFDQYSLALTFCELVSGRIPFQGEGENQVVQRIRGEMDVSFLPATLRPIITRALSPDPSKRFSSCRTLVRVLCDGLAAQEGANASPTPETVD